MYPYNFILFAIPNDTPWNNALPKQAEHREIRLARIIRLESKDMFVLCIVRCEMLFIGELQTYRSVNHRTLNCRPSVLYKIIMSKEIIWIDASIYRYIYIYMYSIRIRRHVGIFSVLCQYLPKDWDGMRCCWV